jgi:hypothetical protein
VAQTGILPGAELRRVDFGQQCTVVL